MGIMSWPDGSKYEGDFINGKMEGSGTKTFANGNKWTGAWKNNLQHGQGQAYNAKTGVTSKEEYREGKKWTWGHSNMKEVMDN